MGRYQRFEYFSIEEIQNSEKIMKNKICKFLSTPSIKKNFISEESSIFAELGNIFNILTLWKNATNDYFSKNDITDVQKAEKNVNYINQQRSNFLLM